MSTIIDTGNVAEIQDLGPDDEISNMDATSEPTGRPMEFHVQMRGHTFSDMQDLIVHAAAQQLISGFGGPDKLQKLIEAKCIDMITAKADAALAKVTAEIIDQPVTPKYSYSKPDAAPVTMRELIGLTGKQYLTELVDHNGKVSDRSSYNQKSRIQYLVEQALAPQFKRELEQATSAAISEVQSKIRAKHEALLEDQKARMRDALAKATGAA